MATTEHDAVQRLSVSTLRTYAADWALFSDWCAATGTDPLPADPGTVLAFLAGCPATGKTQRGRVRAIDHRHSTTGHPPPGGADSLLAALGRAVPGPYEPASGTVAAVEAALRILPSHGWTKGMFGRRDRCLLVLSEIAGIPYTHLAALTAGHLVLSDGTVRVTAAGRDWSLHPVENPVLCGPCAVARWLEVLDTVVTKISTAAVAYLVGNAEPVTAQSPHVCRSTLTMAVASGSVPLLPPINQWGALPFPHPGLTPHAHSRRSRDYLAGEFVIHRDLPFPTDDDTAALPPVPIPVTTVGTEYGKTAAQRAWAKRRADLRRLAGVADVLSDIDQQIADLQNRVTALLAEQTT